MSTELEPPPGDGPYRTPPAPPRRRRWPVGALLGLAAVALVGLIVALWPSDEARSRPSLPEGAFGGFDSWPPPEAELPPATPLGPLLAADAPEGLALLYPREGATRLARGESLTLRFNRPMVEGRRVGSVLEESPLRFSPPLAGEARWSSRSSLVFTPSRAAFGTAVREVRLELDQALTSLGGEVLEDALERVLVLDGAPRVLTHLSSGRVSAGAPLPLVFDAPVDLGSLRREVMAFEVRGGQRSLPVSFGRVRPTDQGISVDMRLGRGLEPGSQIAVALAPRYSRWGGHTPLMLTYQLEPRPRVEGIDCTEGASFASQCRHTEIPGAVIDIGPTLRLLSSARLAGLEPRNVSVRPPVSGLSLRLAPHGPPARRLMEIEAEWEADQVYEVRVQGLTAERGEAVRPPPPLAIRSAGHSPSVRVATGQLSYERDAPARIAVGAINPGLGSVAYRAVQPGSELAAFASPRAFVRDATSRTPLPEIVPDARANRWGRGHFAWRGQDERESAMAVVGFDPGAPTRRIDHVAFVQATDLGVSVRAQPEGLLAWVTSLSAGGPVRGARVKLADAEGRLVGEASTDRDGLARFSRVGDPFVSRHIVLVTAGDDRAALLFDPRRALGPAGAGVEPGPRGAALARVASVFTDRGAYRPGEGLHAYALLRRVEGAEANALAEAPLRLALYGPGQAAPASEVRGVTSARGVVTGDFTIPAAAALGSWRLEATDEAGAVLGQAEVRVAEFRQPSFRVDLGQASGPRYHDEVLHSEVQATYLFGAPVGAGRLSWSLERAGAPAVPARWSRFRFEAADAGSSGRGTVASGEERLSAEGGFSLRAPLTLATPSRARYSLEAEVTDEAGHAQAARRSFVVHPAEVEVGLAGGADWVSSGEALEIEAVVIDASDEPRVGHPIEARFVREGWHSWWEWSRAASRSGEGDAYRLRRDHNREVVHRCSLRSEAEPVRCAHTPSRAGTYVLEVEARDAAGRTSLASRRLYVAGPDEHPDRDPPGAPITLSAARARLTVGETAEIAFESPFEVADALITVEREGVLHSERRPVGPGGQVIRLPVTEAMVPNAFVGVTLVRPRVGPPGERVDVSGPDLRFGLTELTVRPATARLDVRLEVPEEARPGEEVEVVARVRDAAGRPVAAEVLLWAVDEGTLRLTGYQTPDAVAGVWRRRSPVLAWDDLRRGLVSRLDIPAPREGGDGGHDGSSRRLDARERFEPTPLWAPRLTTDREGRARVTLRLPERPTEYRVMAVAVDDGVRAGRASSALLARAPLVARAALPRFLTEGDVFEATYFLHNTGDEAVEAEVRLEVAGRARSARRITLEPRADHRFVERVEVPAEGALALRLSLAAGDESVRAEDSVPIVPRARFVRAQRFAALESGHRIRVEMPAGTPRAGGFTRVALAAHPFVGTGAVVEALERSPFADAESHAATLGALAAHAEIAEGLGLSQEAQDELDARGRRALARLLALQTGTGGFLRLPRSGGEQPYETALAVEALALAERRGWLEDRAPLTAALARLGGFTAGASFGDLYGRGAPDRLAFALRVLRELDAPREARAEALLEQREQLGPAGLAELARALDGDARAEGLIADACEQVLTDRDDEASDPSRLRIWERGPDVLAPILGAAARFEVGHAHAGPLARALLGSDAAAMGRPFGGGPASARVLIALAEYAAALGDAEVGRVGARFEGSALTRVAEGTLGAHFALPFERALRGGALEVEGDGLVFLSLESRHGVPLGEPDTIARGRRVALHRVYETAHGAPIADGEAIPLGTLVRVRLFLHHEGSAPPMVVVRDPLPAGFEAVDESLESSPRQVLAGVLGLGVDDGAVDARAHHAMRTASSISHRAFESDASYTFFEHLPAGLREVTYAIRASSVGSFTAPPASIEALHEPDFIGRSAVSRLDVVREVR